MLRRKKSFLPTDQSSALGPWDCCAPKDDITSRPLRLGCVVMVSLRIGVCSVAPSSKVVAMASKCWCRWFVEFEKREFWLLPPPHVSRGRSGSMCVMATPAVTLVSRSRRGSREREILASPAATRTSRGRSGSMWSWLLPPSHLLVGAGEVPDRENSGFSRHHTF
jgi:hypothetical protein